MSEREGGGAIKPWLDRRPPSQGEAGHAGPPALVDSVDLDGRVLLFRGVDRSRPQAGSWWFPAGGGLQPGESHQDAARRELFEETGLEVDRLGGVATERSVRLKLDGIDYQGEEQYFLVRTSPFEIATDRWTEVERRVVLEHRWSTRVELRTTTDAVCPEGLVGFLDELDG